MRGCAFMVFTCSLRIPIIFWRHGLPAWLWPAKPPGAAGACEDEGASCTHAKDVRVKVGRVEARLDQLKSSLRITSLTDALSRAVVSCHS
jgi:hypothetical protein